MAGPTRYRSPGWVPGPVIAGQISPAAMSRRPRPMVRGSYDAARTTDENRRHWQNADSLSANAALTPEVRRLIRNRARYESANNSYAAGIVLTMANDCVGAGPILQMATGSRTVDSKIEMAWARWARAIDLGEKLRTIHRAKKVDGEAFGVLVNNPRVQSEILLDLRLIESDRVCSPLMPRNNAGDKGRRSIDGVVVDSLGTPIAFQVLREHPGDMDFSGSMESDEYDAEQVLHLYRTDRPEQSRGVSELAPALSLFAMLRRYTLATVTAAESAANMAGVLYTDGPADEEDPGAEPGDLWELERNMFTALPAGTKMAQVKAEQPVSTYDVFVRALLREIARALNCPYNVAALDSSGHNYASGRLDYQSYGLELGVERSRIAQRILDPLLRAFLREAALTGIAPRQMADEMWVPHEWRWTSRGHVDPTKGANAEATSLRARTTTYAEVYATKGLDWEEQFEQSAREQARARELGLVLDTLPIPVPVGAPTQSDDDDDEEVEDDE